MAWRIARKAQEYSLMRIKGLVFCAVLFGVWQEYSIGDSAQAPRSITSAPLAVGVSQFTIDDEVIDVDTLIGGETSRGRNAPRHVTGVIRVGPKRPRVVFEPDAELAKILARTHIVTFHEKACTMTLEPQVYEYAEGDTLRFTVYLKAKLRELPYPVSNSQWLMSFQMEYTAWKSPDYIWKFIP
jgi:hypothetical protein